MDTKDLKPFELKDFEPNKDSFIEASAGTGKTYTIQLMVARLIGRGVPLKKILIVTYTEKAAGELKDRIRKKIAKVLQTGRIDENAAELLPEEMPLDRDAFEKAYRDVDNAAIFTIHSFCQKALKEYAYDAGKPFDVSMVDDGAVEELIENKIRDVWSKSDLFQDLIKGKGDVKGVVEDLTERLVSAINLYKGSHNGEEIVKQEKVLVEWLDDGVTKEDAEAVITSCQYSNLIKFPKFKKAMEVLEANVGKEFNALRTASKKNKETNKTEYYDVPLNGLKISDFVKTIKNWDISQGNLFTGQSFGNKLVDVPGNEFGNSLKHVHARVTKLTGASGIQNSLKQYLSNNYPINKFLSDSTKELFDEWQKTKSDSKLQSYNDMILSVHDAVLNGSGLKEKLQAEYTYAIIDEFQDTNQLQWDIFKELFWHKSNHSIFVVGDPKQSIYSFQGADVNVYNKAITDITEKNGRRLACNYRSTNGIIHACNELFKEDFFAPADGMNKLVDFTSSISPDKKNPPDPKKATPQYCGKLVPSVWLCKGGEDGVNEHDFARAVVKQIVDWCSLTEEKDEKGKRKTKLQVFDKDHPEKLCNLKLKDIAILARSRTEMQVIESYLKQAHVPFTQYKENNLFKSRECAEWIALFRALNAPDFSGWNRKLLNEILITDFFRDGLHQDDLDDLHYVESKIFDNPEVHQRKQLNEWRALALKKRYAEMLEHIYDDTRIDDKLTDRASLQELARLRQIGNYAIDYLYNHNCSLEDLVRHLEGLARFNESTDDENGDLVEKGSDSEMVQVMTIHASKGLEFPVVISVAGFKGYYEQAKGPFLYHNKDDIYLGFGSNAKAARKKEELEEWKRLFYVDFTRASSILVLPYYSNWIDGRSSDNYTFLKKAVDRITTFPVADPSESTLTEENVITHICILNSVSKNEWKPAALSKKIDNILLNSDESKDSLEAAKSACDNQKKVMSDLQGKLGGKAIMQFSYSTLAGRNDGIIDKSEGLRSNTAEETEAIQSDEVNELNKDIDTEAISQSYKHDNSIDETTSTEIQKWKEIEKSYPRGNKVGNVLHNTLEWMPFSKFFEKSTEEDCYKTFDAACGYKDLIEKLNSEFKAEALPIDKHAADWTNLSIWFIWNTLHAKLPIIEGGEFKDASPFELASLPDNDHKPEVQFGLAAEIGGTENKFLQKFCKGFIDLLFVRPDADGKKRFSILDWKSDYLEEYSAGAIKEKVDKEYSVQRVLYSYCLIQWLKQFYGPGTQENLQSEQDIFDKHFGGIYYAFLRGTVAGTDRGIYAQTWNDFEALKDAYKNVYNLMNKGKNNDKNAN